MLGLRSLMRLGWLLRELKGLRGEMAGLRLAAERVAAALELQNAHAYPQVIQASPDSPAVQVSYTDDQAQLDLMEIELRLTGARGSPPTEEEVLVEWERLRGEIQ